MSGETVDLEAIEARANAATPGPWRIGIRIKDAVFINSPNGQSHITSALPPAADREADADFIAHARTDIPALVAEVRRLREALNEVLFYVTAGGPSRMFGTREMYDCLIEKSRVDGWRAAVGGEPR